MERLIELGCDTAVELSAQPVLTAAVTECYQHQGKNAIVLPSLRRHEDERATMLHSLGALLRARLPDRLGRTDARAAAVHPPAALPMAARTVLARGR